MSDLTVPGEAGRPQEAGADRRDEAAPGASAAPAARAGAVPRRRLPGVRPVPAGAVKPAGTAKPAARAKHAPAPPSEAVEAARAAAAARALAEQDEDADDAPAARRWRLPRTDVEVRRAILIPAIAFCLLSSAFWLIFASNRYVSEAHVLIQKTELPNGGGIDFGGFLGGIGSSGDRSDQMRMRDYMMSTDMLRLLDKRLHLRAHYSDWHRDPFTRLWSSNATMEDFQSYFQNRVKIDYDDTQGVLVVTAQAFDPKTAQAIVQTMVTEGEAFMNRSDHELVAAQVRFLESEAERTNQRNLAARQAVIDYQGKEGLLSPEQAVEHTEGIVAQLEAHRTALQTQLRTMQAYLVPTHPEVVAVQQQIDAVNQQIKSETDKMVAPGGVALNRKTERFQRLQQDAVFAQQVYQTTLAALEKGRIDAMRMVRKITVVQQPTLAERPTQPRRFYNALVFSLVTMLAAGIALLLTAIVRDHMD